MATSSVQRVVSVGERHIAQGVAQSNYSCPIALALTEAGYPAVVAVQFSRLDIGADTVSMANAPAVQQWISRFDAGERVAPIDIAINVAARTLWAC